VSNRVSPLIQLPARLELFRLREGKIAAMWHHDDLLDLM
jgi:hypothetical protein